jgi:rubrerythrin
MSLKRNATAIDLELRAVNRVWYWLHEQAREAAQSADRRVYEGLIDAAKDQNYDSGLVKCDGCGWAREVDPNTSHCPTCTRESMSLEESEAEFYKWKEGI